MMPSDKPRIITPSQRYEAAFEALNGDLDGRLRAWDYLQNSTAIYHGEVIRIGYLPKIYDLAMLVRLKRIAEQTAIILDKITQRYLDDAEYRKLFGFSPLTERLICLETGYRQLIPIMRADIFIDEADGDFMFCELNTDGSSAMNEDREICNALALTPSFAQARQDMTLDAQELFDPWVECFLQTYDEWAAGAAGTDAAAAAASAGTPQVTTATRDKKPLTVAIVDYRQSMSRTELEEFRSRFEAAGCTCLICDIPDLSYRDGSLYGIDLNPEHFAHRTAQRIDAVYRRAVTSEVIADINAAAPEQQKALLSPDFGSHDNSHQLRGVFALCAAVASNAVCMQGGFRTQVAHSKTTFKVLHQPQTLAFLTPEERDFIHQHIPFTAALTADEVNLEEIKGDKKRWIIKPVDGYGSVGVHAGQSFEQDDWEQLIDAHSDGSYVVQRYCQQYAMPNTLPLPLTDAREPLFCSAAKAQDCIRDGNFAPRELQNYNVLTGLFIYNGAFSGVFSRAGTDALIVGFKGGVSLGVLLADYDPAQAKKLGLGVCPRNL